jgi:ABC-2 type transport system permease protein
MRAYWTLTRRELGSYFLSLTGYIIIAVALFLMGLSFLVLLQSMHGEATQMPITERWYITPFFWVILVLTTPVITMRLFALEKFTGTFETLMTTPVADAAVVLAKFTAALLFYLVMWLPLLACLFIVRHYINAAPPFDAGALASTYLGIVLFGAMFISLGCCASALTGNQVVAAMLSLVFGVSLFLLAFVAERFPEAGNWQAQILSCFALGDQMRDFVRGLVDTRTVVFYVSLTLFFLFLTLRVVESRRWK